jgi:hypothetical protein
MKNETDILNELAIVLNIDPDDVEPYIIIGYLALRLNPLLNVQGITKEQINELIDAFSTMYFTEDYTLDILINAVYNYINATGKCPPNELFDDNIETFLKEYGN